MGWEIGFDHTWDRDIGYGVPALCDQPGCDAKINRGLSYVCCGEQPHGGDEGCGLYFCEEHHCYRGMKCERCHAGKAPFDAKPDIAEWTTHKMTDESWSAWRVENGFQP